MSEEIDDLTFEVSSTSADSVETDNGSRTFPDDVYKLNDPLNTYKAYTSEQICAAYPSGPLASCRKCRATYAIDPLAMEYATGEHVVGGYKEKGLVYPARVVYVGDANFTPDDQDELPWNIAAAMTPEAVASWSTQQNTSQRVRGSSNSSVE
ncbi:hypothetical protein AB0C84_15840 [Actinomadura sp. NPDC048955]|uniref:hypothetical protein n=1 Tax=Actinomadura sp. NPDC048955 TaxID=3158228 RepID=UPI0033E16C62